MIPDQDLGHWRSWWSDDDRPRLGVSTCLLGEPVRHDGGHTRDPFVVDVLAPFVHLLRRCPEVEVGMGTPRPTIRLIEGTDGPQLVAPSTGADLTNVMTGHGQAVAREIQEAPLDGYLFKKGSPSCGLYRIKVYTPGGHVSRRNGRGMFADQLLRAQPDLPAEEEGRMNDTGLREDFVERVFAHHRLRRFLEDGPTRHGLVRFHTAHKAMLFTRHEPGSRELGAFLGNAGRQDIGALTQGYADRFRAILAHRSTAGRHTNVLHHAMGHLKRILDSAQKRQLLAAIEDYRLGHQPRSLALTLIDFLARSHEVEYLRGQLYFDPCPKELLPGDRTRRAWPRTSVA